MCPSNGWLRGWGLDPSAFGSAPVGTAALAPVLDGVPAFIDLFDAHSAPAGERALERAGIDGPRRFAQGSEIVCDAAGRPTGPLLEDVACALVEAVASRPTEAEVRARSAEVLRAMAASGLTGRHAMDADGDSLAGHAAPEAQDALPLRPRIAPWCRPETDDAAVAELIRLQGTGGTLWRVAGVKLFMDGTIDNGTAWLETPDCHGASAHAYWPDPQRCTQVITALHRAGVPTAAHAIGNAAVRHVPDPVEPRGRRTARAGSPSDTGPT
nr:amidohydrolase family protein [Streptomyces sp. CoH27]